MLNSTWGWGGREHQQKTCMPFEIQKFNPVSSFYSWNEY